MFPFLPLIDSPDDDLLQALDRIAPFLLNAIDLPRLNQRYLERYLEILPQNASNIDQATFALDRGAQIVVVSHAAARDLVGNIPASRIHLLLDAGDVSAIPDKVRSGVSGVLVKSKDIDISFLKTIANFFKGSSIYLWSSSSPKSSSIRELQELGITLVIPTSALTLGETSVSQLNIPEAFVATLKSDRPDNLFPTVVSSSDQGGKSLGLVYSSIQSISECIISGKGVYQSRKRGLWRKGETSGALQDVVRIVQDCDSDSLEVQVRQRGSGFCHTGAFSCFGELSGLAALEKTLVSRLESAPDGSYTRRLFNDAELLNAKIREEADELCQAKSSGDMAFEAADLFYFALTKCISNGVSLQDVERSLDQKAKKISRRHGNAKQAYLHPANPASSAQPKPELIDESAPVTLRKHDTSRLSQQERSNLLKRPVLNSLEMIAKVEPIVNDVRKRGDKALLELTAKFDRAQLDQPTILPRFSEASMELPANIRDAIDCAYENIKKFHEAQLESHPLKVETMPGVVCSRFARCISRVGLYVPGGTAVLPSTALMLGIPAQVAGCKEIVIATPPRSDGSVSPEVVYAAHKIGATVILKAGGAQAIAALAYGTESVPKVDKIFGPGNQWVTAAKMLVQNDTDALVAIDMPAGPSEVLVIADSSANPAFVAADLLSQAEHGIDSQVVLVAINFDEEMMLAIEEQLDVQARALPRFDILKESLRKSLIVQVPNKDAAVEFSNDYAPEHLILHLVDAPAVVDRIQNAGSIFVGPWTPESCGDYASGTNHTLPTNGYARQFSGVNTLSFQKHITSQEITRDGLEKLGPVVATLADAEGLQAHANAVRIRLAKK